MFRQQTTRRTFLGASLGANALSGLAACAANPSTPQQNASGRILPTDPLVAEYEKRRAASGATVSKNLSAAPFNTTLDGTNLTTWGYDGNLNGPLLRAKVGDQLKVAVNNGLPQETSVHWHGLALRNNADGVQGLTQDPIPAGNSYTYDFRLSHPGTYWYHSHFDTQRERALYGALIIEDPNETLKYDDEWVVILDDWLDGITGTPDEVYQEISRGMNMSGGMGNSGSMSGMDHGSMGGMDHGNMSSSAPSSDSSNMPMKHMLMGATSEYLGGDAGDVKIPVHLFNGRTAMDPDTFKSSAGKRIRLRLINAAGDTAYRVGIPGQKFTITHTDGFPVKHQEADAVVLGMGERLDVLVTVGDQPLPVLALPEGKTGHAFGVIASGSKEKFGGTLPTSLGGTVLDGSKLKADESVLLAPKEPTRKHELHLTGSMMKYDWGINGKRFNMDNPYDGAFDIKLGERVRVSIINDTEMWHPMHLHGHTFQLANNGARKDTVIVKPKETVVFDFEADNPGQWLTHCHNAYHAEAGMMGVFSYIQ